MRVQKQIKIKKVKLIVQISFAEKIKFKEKGSVIVQNFFSSIADFRDVVSVLPCSPTIKASRIFVAVQKRLIDHER